MAVKIPDKIIAGDLAEESLVPKGWLEAKRKKRILELNKKTKSELLRTRGWHKGYQVIPVTSVEEHDTLMGFEIASKIKEQIDLGNYLAIILPVGPMGQYKYVVHWLNIWKTDLSKVYTFNMDEWSNKKGEALKNSAESFKDAMHRALFDPLKGKINPKQTNFATQDNLPNYTKKMTALRDLAEKEGTKLFTLLVHGIGQGCHIAFWEPHFAEFFPSIEKWKSQTHMLGAPLCVMTLEQNAITSFSSDIFGPSPYANTIGPGIYLNADYVIGGCDGALRQSGNESYSMTWQSQAVHMTLGWGEDDPWVPSAWVPRTLPGKLFVIDYLLEPINSFSH